MGQTSGAVRQQALLQPRGAQATHRGHQRIDAGAFCGSADAITDDGALLVFHFAADVTYVDKDGKTLEAAGLRKHLRVPVAHAKTGRDYVADRVAILQ